MAATPEPLCGSKNRDEATNTLFELSSKDFELRGDILEAETNAKGDPMVQVSDIPLPQVPGEEVETAAVDAAAVDAAAVDTESAPETSDESITEPEPEPEPDTQTS